MLSSIHFNAVFTTYKPQKNNLKHFMCEWFTSDKTMYTDRIDLNKHL